MTETKRTDRAALPDTEETILLNSILESSTEYSIVAMDLNETIVAWNEAARRIYGYPAAEVVGKASALTLHDPEDVKSGRAREILEEVLKAGKWEGNLKRVRKDGSRFTAHVTFTLRRDLTGEPLGFTMISRDLTESERIERELRESQEYNRGLIESNIDALMTTDPIGIITDPRRAEDGIRKVLAEDRVTNYELTMRAKDGRETVVSYNATTFRSADGKLKGVFAAARDIPLAAALVALLIVLPTEALAQARDATAETDLTELTPEQLANLEVTSVSKKPEKRWTTAAAIHVITREDIRRAGATSLVDALRLAPGLQVARINSNQWAVGIRGFASRLSRSMLVLIDGRSVYTPLFAGTYWEVQDVLLEDVERIEVIRGPGGTLWGANAVTGVINIITRSSRDTQGTFATAGGGTLERAFVGLRHGGASGDRLSYRVYGKAFDRGPEFHSTTGDFDDWHMFQGGFRADWEKAASDTVTLQGALYGGRAGQHSSITSLSPPSSSVVETDSDLSGANLVARWQHVSTGGAQWSAGAYYDRTNRRDPSFMEVRNTADLDVQRRDGYGRHDLILGLGYRASSGATSGVPTVAFLPPDRTDQLWTGFVTDALTLATNRLVLDAGVKLEHNDYSGFEAQPTLRLLWTPSPRHSLWLSGARAVRTPSRVEHDLLAYTLIDARTPIFARIVGNKAFSPEKTLTGELGYRIQPHTRLTVDSVVFYNDHQGLLSVEPGPPFREASPPPPRLVVPLRLANGLEGSSYGAEVAADWSPVGNWRLAGSYCLLRLSLRPSPGSLDTSTAASTNGTAPRHTGLVQSHLNLGSSANFDLTARFVSALPALNIASYVGLDARLAWRPAARLEIAVVGQNLASPHHAEFAAGGLVTELRRGAYGGVSWRP